MTEKKKEKPKIETLAQALHYIQMNLHAPKNQFNKFGNYKYRSCEDILEGLKKTMPDNCYVTIEDDIVMVGNRVYVKAVAKLCFGSECVSNMAFAREPENRKGMDDSQITGATSSYARKYALNGLFLIDDVKDADSQDKPEKQEKKEPSKEGAAYLEMKKQIEAGDTIEAVKYVFDSFVGGQEVGGVKFADLPESGRKNLEKICADKIAQMSQAPLDNEAPF